MPKECDVLTVEEKPYELIASNNTPVTVDEMDPGGTLMIKELNIQPDKQSGDYKVVFGLETDYPGYYQLYVLTDQDDTSLDYGFITVSPFSKTVEFTRTNLTKVKIKRWESGNLPLTSTTFEVYWK